MAAKKPIKKPRPVAPMPEQRGGSFKFFLIGLVALMIALAMFQYRIQINETVHDAWSKITKVQKQEQKKKSAPVGYKKQDREDLQDLINKEAK